MAEVALPTNQIFDFLALLAKRRWWILIPALWGITFALVALCFIPKRYESKTIVEVKEVRFEEDRLFGNPSANPYKDLQNIKIKILQEPYLINTINDRLQWGDFLGIANHPGKRKIYLDQVRERCGVELAKKTKDAGIDLITITYKDEDPKRAADFVKNLTEIWKNDTLHSFYEQISGELIQEQRQNNELSQQLQLVRRQITELQEEHKLSPTQASDRRTSTDEDWVVKQYNQSKLDLLRIEGEVKAAQERSKKADERYANEPAFVQIPPDKVTNTPTPGGDSSLSKALSDQIVKLRTEIVDLQGKQTGMSKTNYKRKEIQKDIDKKLALIKEIEGQQVKSGIVPAPGVEQALPSYPNDQKRIFKQEADRAKEDLDVKLALLATQKAINKDIAEDFKKRPEIFDRYHQLETSESIAEKQFKDSTEKVDRKRLILQKIDSASSNPYRILEEPVPAESATDPSVPIILAIGLVAGSAVGLAWIFLREFVRPSFRNVHDVAASLSLPILGMVNRMLTVREIRRDRVRGVFGIGVSLVCIFALAGTAGVYLSNPKWLPPDLVHMVDNVKQKFR